MFSLFKLMFSRSLKTALNFKLMNRNSCALSGMGWALSKLDCYVLKEISMFHMDFCILLNFKDTR